MRIVSYPQFITIFGLPRQKTVSKDKLNSGVPIILQIVKLIPPEILNTAVSETQADAYYKTLTTQKQLVCMMYGIITKCNSFNLLSKNLQFLHNKLTSIGIDDIPARSTLADSNTNRKPEVFGLIYSKLYKHYSSFIDNESYSLISDVDGQKKIELIDSSTFSLFQEVFKGVGRNSLTGTKKGGLKIHTKLPLGGVSPSLVHLTEAACCDKIFLGQLNIQPNTIYVFDKGYASYKRWKDMDNKGAFWVTRLNKNANYEIVKQTTYDCIDYADGGIIKDAVIGLKTRETTLKARLVVYKDPESGKVLSFVTNLFGYNPFTIAQLYKYRWSIEVFFKRLKQNFQTDYFFSDSSNGIKTQIWLILIANLLMSVIHHLTKQKESFTTTVSMAACNMSSYTSLIAIISQERPSKKPKIRIVQLNLFSKNKGVLY